MIRRASFATSSSWVRLMMHPVAQPDVVQRLLGQLTAVCSRNAGVDQRQLDVLQRRGSSEKIERLEHEPDLLVTHRCQLVVLHRLDRRSIEDVLPRGRTI